MPARWRISAALISLIIVVGGCRSALQPPRSPAPDSGDKPLPAAVILPDSLHREFVRAMAASDSVTRSLREPAVYDSLTRALTRTDALLGGLARNPELLLPSPDTFVRALYEDPALYQALVNLQRLDQLRLQRLTRRHAEPRP